MFFLTPIVAGLMLVGTFGTGAYVQDQVREVVGQYNLSAVAHVLEIYRVDHYLYPSDLKELLKGGELKNINLANYDYQVTSDGQMAILKSNGYCWQSNIGLVTSCILE